MAKPNYKQNNKSIQCTIGGIEIKGLEDAMTIGGFISTTHLDEGFINTAFSDGELLVPEAPEGAHIRDRCDLELLKEWEPELNSGVPRANKVSIQHDRNDPIVAGVVSRGSAIVRELPDGEHGLYVDDIIDPTHDTFETTQTRLDIGTYDGFSIEFNNAVYDIQEHDDYYERTLLPGTKLKGHAIVPRPMNEYAMRLKEIDKNMNKVNKDNLNFKTEEVTETTNKETLNTEDNKMTEEIKTEAPKQEEVKSTFTDEQMKEYMDLKKAQEAKSEEDKMATFKASILAEVKKGAEDVKVEDKAGSISEPEEKKESPEMVSFKEAVGCKRSIKSGSVHYEASIDMQWKSAGKLADSLKLTDGGIATTKSLNVRNYKNFQTNGRMLEMKGLGITTNQGSTYYLSAPELQDIFDPVIYNTLNQSTTTWALLNKDDFSTKGNNQVQFKVKTAINNSLDTSTNGFYTGNAVVTGNGTRLQAQTKFKKQAVGVEVDGDMIAAAKGGPVGDVFALEVASATEDLMQYANIQLFAETGLETGAQPIGFEYITDSAGNTTMYGYTRSSYTTFLAPSSAGDTYINGNSADITLTNLRAAKRQALKQGASLDNLFFTCDHIQGDKFRGIYDAIQRVAPTSSRFGFEGMLEFDGIPIFEDKDCNDDDWFLIDSATHRLAIWVPPTLEMLGKDSDADKGFIKMYWCAYNLHPIRMVQIYGNATS